jgi:serine/threonine-protein kinase
VGKYQILSHIATGGMGAVYKAHDPELRRDVALKILPPEMAAKPALLERFKREAIHAARLRHENIVAIYECGEAEDTHFLALEFVDGIDLGEYIRRQGKLDPEEARLIMVQAARALVHAHANNIVHRDVKPSNFLITRPHDALVVKMTDFGLAREASEEDFRVTRAGTTVGTIDYISPEQARDSRAADIRSDLYSLGCTLYHMLAGQPPFPDGGLTERLYKHMEDEPPDVHEFNPRVGPGLRAILDKLLQKKPENRYQTPAALLHDLIHIDEVRQPAAPVLHRDALAELEKSEAAIPTARKRGQPKRRRVPPRQAKAARPDEDTRADLDSKTGFHPSARRSRRWLLASGVVLLGVCLGLGLVATLIHAGKPVETSPGEIEQPIAEEPPVRSSEPKERRTTQQPETGTPPRQDVQQVRPAWPPLFEPVPPLDVEKLNQKFAENWQMPAPPPDAPLFRISRFPRGDNGPHFDSLAVACAAAPEHKITIIEIHDNGPFFTSAVVVKNRSLILRAGRGYRPLVIWDTTVGDRESPPDAFVTVSHGSLALENLELAVRRDEATPASFASVWGGDFSAYGCTFSVSGKSSGAVAAIRLERPDDAPAPHCRFRSCFGRGSALEVARVQGSGAQVELHDCLFVGGDHPLLRVRGFQPAATTIRATRSTFVASRVFLEVKPDSREITSPGVHWTGWNVVISRSAEQSGGSLVELARDANADGLKWEAFNCCYAGWKQLLSGRETVGASEFESWQRKWGYGQSERAASDCWPAAVTHDAAEAGAAAYQPAPFPASPVGFAAAPGAGPVGCDVAALAPTRNNWVALAFERAVLPSLDVLSGSAAPEIPAALDGLYHGERLDLARVRDLGEYLRKVQQAGKIAPKVVLRLSGSGEHKTSPIRWKGGSLILFVEPPAREDAAPLTLVPHDPDPSDFSGWIQVENGNLDLIGLEVRCPDFKLVLLPPYLIDVRGGNLRLDRCRIYGPRLQAPDAFRALLHAEGSGKPAADQATVCTLNESVLVCGKTCIRTDGIGARIAARQCVLVSATDAIVLAPTTARARLNLSCELDHASVAAQRSVVRLFAAAGTETPFEPLVVQAQACAFLAPFAGQRSGVLTWEEDALARGILVWQGEGNVFDKRLHFYGVGADVPERPQPFSVWSRLWGPVNEQRPFLNLALTNTLKWEPLQPERLVLPEIKPVESGQPKPRPGADLAALGLLPKPSKPK